MGIFAHALIEVSADKGSGVGLVAIDAYPVTEIHGESVVRLKIVEKRRFLGVPSEGEAIQARLRVVAHRCAQRIRPLHLLGKSDGDGGIGGYSKGGRHRRIASRRRRERVVAGVHLQFGCALLIERDGAIREGEVGLLEQHRCRGHRRTARSSDRDCEIDIAFLRRHRHHHSPQQQNHTE